MNKKKRNKIPAKHPLTKSEYKVLMNEIQRLNTEFREAVEKE